MPCSFSKRAMNTELESMTRMLSSGSSTSTSPEVPCSNPKKDVTFGYHVDDATELPSDSECSDISEFSAFGKRLSDRSNGSSSSTRSRGAPVSTVASISEPAEALLDVGQHEPLPKDEARKSGSKNGSHAGCEMPLWLALDCSDHVHMVQGTKLVSSKVGEQSSTRQSKQPDGEKKSPEKKLCPDASLANEHTTAGDVFAGACEAKKSKNATDVPLRPPGFFVQPPPGLSLPHHAVIGMVKRDQMPGDALETSTPVCKPRPAAPAVVAESALQKHTFVWQADARKLTSSDKVIVSPRFEFEAPSGNVAFRVMMYPREAGNAGRVSFKKARSIGNLQIKTETDVRVKAGLDVKLGKDFAKIKFAHTFGESSSMCKVPGTWNFFQAIDKASQTLQIAVTITSQ